MEVSSKKLRRCDLVVAKGRIDASTVNTLSQALTEIKEAGRYRIVLSMKDVSYISSVGLSELVNTQRDCRQMKRGELVLAEVAPRVREVLDLAGLTTLFNLFDTEAEAVGYF